MKETDIAGILTSTYTIALVGASDKPDRPSYRVMKYPLDRGITSFRFRQKLPAKRCWASRGIAPLADVPEKVDMVDVFRNSEAAWAWHRKLLPSARKPSGMQLGVINEQAAVLARDAGLNVVTDSCPAIEIPRRGLANSKIPGRQKPSGDSFRD
ncbi:CoA-binding protein [Escherichia coli]